MSLVAERLFVGSELSARSLPNLQVLTPTLTPILTPTLTPSLTLTLALSLSLPNLQAHGVTHVVNCATLPNAHEGRPGMPSYLPQPEPPTLPLIRSRALTLPRRAILP